MTTSGMPRDAPERTGDIGNCSDQSDHTTFASAAARLLDREISAELAYALADPAPAGSLTDANRETAALFRVGKEWFALAMPALDEIIPPRPIHTLPHSRHPALLGLINVRGQLVICVSISQLLLGAASSATPARLLVARHAADRFAMPVDEIQHTHQYSPSDLIPAPSTVARSASSYTRDVIRWKDKTVARLDETLLFEALSRCLA
jgi:chemotaxis-related protein WspD